MGPTAIISWCVFGLIVGAIARFLMPGVQRLGCLLTIVLGVVGSFVGGAISSFLFSGTAAMQPAGWIASILGAMLTLFVCMKLRK